MAKHKVAELEGALLDAAVAKALADPDIRTSWGDQPCAPFMEGGDGQSGSNITAFAPSRNWEHGGPIIERERIAPQPEVRGDIGNEWADAPERTLGWFVVVGGRNIAGGTYLIAAMRAYVASKFGDEVELPTGT